MKIITNPFTRQSVNCYVGKNTYSLNEIMNLIG